jgi:excisionase family DNA binding protein
MNTASRRPGSAAVDWSRRINAHVNEHDGSVVVPRRVAEWLHDKAGLTYEQRIMLRDSDAELYEVLAALGMVALSRPEDWPCSECGTLIAKPSNQPQDSEAWLTTSRAAELAGVSDRCIRKWIRTQRLPAKRHGRDWRINRAHLQAAVHTA